MSRQCEPWNAPIHSAHANSSNTASAALTVPYTGFYASDMDEYRHVPHEILYWALWQLNFRPDDLAPARDASRDHWLKALSYQPLNPKFLNAGEFYLRPQLGLEEFTSWVRRGVSFSFVKLGDGEELCMRGERGQNCDGQPYSEELGQRLKESFTFLAGRPTTHVRHWVDQAGVNLLLHRTDHDNGPVKEFWVAVRESLMLNMVVGPPWLKDLMDLLMANAFIEVPETDAFQSYEEARRRLLSAGPMAKVLIADVLRQNPSATCLDAGSSFDSLYRGHQTRTGQLDHDAMASLYRRELGQPFVSICVPVLGRPEQTARLIEAVHRNAGFPRTGEAAPRL